MGKYILYFHFSTSDCNRVFINLNVSNLDNQQIIFPIFADKYISLLQIFHCIVRVFYDVRFIFNIGKGNSVTVRRRWEQNRFFCINQEICISAFFKLQHSFRFIVINRRCKQFLHLTCIQRCLISRTKRREIVLVQHECRSHKIIRHTSRKGKGNLIFLRGNRGAY